MKHMTWAIAAAMTVAAGAHIVRAQGAAQASPQMSFFITSVGSGKGGDLGGLAGADAHCQNLAKAVGGNLLLGFLAAVAFATILAVVSGLALAGAAAISHDLYARVIKKGTASTASELRVSKFASIGLGLVAIVLGIVFGLLLLAGSAEMAISTHGSTIPTLGISEAYRYLPVLIGGVLIAVFSLEHLIARFKGLEVHRSWH